MPLPADTRDSGALAFEIKFLVDAATGRRIRDWARARLEPDPHGEGPFGDQYCTTSLYFDTPGFDVFHRRGSYGRSKLRIRRYDAEHVVFLERKLRRATRLSKRRTPVSLEELRRLGRGADGAWPGQWFHQRLLLRRLQPVCQISYDRLARVGARHTGPIRLTLDEAVRAVASTGLQFADDEPLRALEERMVLELKYRAALPALFRQLVEAFTLTPQAVSKYRFAVDALRLVPEDTAVAPPVGDATYA